MKILILTLPWVFANRIRRDDLVESEESNPECSKSHEMEEMCENNDQVDCENSIFCSWCDESCNVNATALEGSGNIFEFALNQKADHLVEVKGLTEDEQKVIKDSIGDIPSDPDAPSDARSGFFGSFLSDNNFGVRSEPLIPFSAMNVQNRISAQYISCPVNVPFCQRQECTSSIGNPQQNAMDCFRIAGCCFDNNLFVYKSAFGGSFFPAPVCYRAIRTPIFHALAEQITMTTDFLPNFLIPIADKVDAFISDEKRFNLMLEYHQCLSDAPMAPSRMRLETYLTQVWPGYMFMRMRPEGGKFLDSLVDTLSQQCGWESINSRECMMIGCCWSQSQGKCTHPTDLTKIPPEKLVATATWMLTNEQLFDSQTTETTAAPVTQPGTRAPPAPAAGLPPGVSEAPETGLPPGIENTPEESRSGSALEDADFAHLLAQLGGRKRRAVAPERRASRARRQNMRQNMGQGQEARQGLARLTNSQAMGIMMGNQNLNMNPGMGLNQNPLAQFANIRQPNNNPAMNMLLGNMGGNSGANMFSNGLASSLTQTMQNLGNVNSALLSQMGLSAQNPFLMGNNAPQCPQLPAKLNCMAAPKKEDKIDATFMMLQPKMCEVKGCCWDQNLMNQVLLARKSDSIDNIHQFQCPWKAPSVGSKWGLPDLSDSLKGCCSISPCVHSELPAEWTLWGEWTQCTKLCGGGESLRSRSCIGNGFCPGMTDDTQREQVLSRPCNNKPCEQWALWAPWGICSATCGKGQHTRYRSCTDINGREVAPPGVSGGCRGNDQSTQGCKLRPCPEWGVWQPWSQCSSSCGMGNRTRRRACNLPGQCPGSDREMETCGSACWSQWESWSLCSASCYGGQRSRSRECLFMPETGMACNGQTTETAKCNTQYCESWINWQPWSSCANPNGATCGNGDRIRVRECTGQPGAPGCRGSGLESAKCIISTCQWSDWLPSSPCSASCGQGTATFSRACPIPGQCPGADRKTDTCSQALCPGFQNWGEWSECSATCGSGTTRRTRECNGTINIDCRGSVDQRKPCSKPACPNQYGQQPNPYGSQYGMSGYSNQNVLQKLLGNNYQQPNYGQTTNTGNTGFGTNNAFGSNTGYVANTGNSLYGSTNNPYGSSNTGNSLYGNSGNSLYGNTATTPNNFKTLFGGGNFYQNAQNDPWAAVLQGFAG